MTGVPEKLYFGQWQYNKYLSNQYNVTVQTVQVQDKWILMTLHIALLLVYNDNMLKVDFYRKFTSVSVIKFNMSIVKCLNGGLHCQ